MGKEDLDKNITDLQNNLIEKCTKVQALFPNTEGQIREYTDNISYAINMLVTVNKNSDSILFINQINNYSHEGMKKLKYIYEHILDKNNQEQRKRLDLLLNELKRLFKTPATTFEEIQTKLNNIETILNRIDDFQNELSCKILYKKR